ncbi:MAG TPA: GNAT family protein [Candidatus Dormibacteraeota bacterium]|nr:GNAT family protein [Candidatus Dormibacteraeota bacterium]
MTASAFGLRDLWPLYDLRLRTGDLELRYPTEAELPAFADIIEAGLHPAGEMPFAIPFTDVPTAQRNVESYQWWMGSRGRWSADSWTLTFGVYERGTPRGFQDLRADRFPALRTVHTGSWLGFEFQGRGVGKLMRQAVLGLAFDHLGAQVAETEAFLDNPASNRVSLGVGYQPNGFGRLAPHGIPRDTQRFRMTLADWRSRPRPTLAIEGLETCLPLFGLGAEDTSKA